MRNRIPFLAHALLSFLAVSAGLFAATTVSAADMPVYGDALLSGWQDWSWATHSLTATAFVHSGTRSISFVPEGWKAVYLHKDGGASGADYDGLEFWVDGGTASGQNVRIVFFHASTLLADVPLNDYLPGGIKAGTWSHVRLEFDVVGVGNSTVDGIYFQDGIGGTQATVYLDDINLTARPGQGGPLAVSVDPDADRRAINPEIYGVSFTNPTPAGFPAYPLRRWGGNATTRYSWQNDTANRASDWFFINYANGTDPPQLPDGSAADLFIDDTRSHGAQPLLTVPLIGWTPRDRQIRWGFSQAKYGAQTSDECRATDNASWCHADAGNGVLSGGTEITGNDPADTSVAIGPEFVTGWMTHLASRVGTASAGGVKYFALDNEPMLWNSTHRDVHPAPVDYAEIWQKTQSYAAAMKARDPAALTFGPVLWGWCAYFYSAADGCGAGPDYDAHGPFLEWYLGQVENYRQTHGIRLVDYLDIHYYPQANGVALSGDESEATSALRLRSVKGLYDTSYVDESWIAQAVSLIPRMKDIIARKCPGTKLAITEYNWGNDTGLSSALAQVEVLAVFGREGVDAAARWVAPEVGTLVEDAFKLYLNYDGSGSKVAGDSVRATSANKDLVGAYAVRAADNRLFFIFINKDTQGRTVDVTLSGTLAGNLALYGFDGSHRLQNFGTVAPGSGSFSLDLPGRSARLAVGQLACGLPGSVGGVHLQKAGGGANLKLTWTDVSGAAGYQVYEDAAPDGPFSTQTGSSTSGSTGLTVAMPPGNRYYLVAARNACGEGPKG